LTERREELTEEERGEEGEEATTSAAASSSINLTSYIITEREKERERVEKSKSAAQNTHREDTHNTHSRRSTVHQQWVKHKRTRTHKDDEVGKSE
jgi:hypothetical protein